MNTNPATSSKLVTNICSAEAPTCTDKVAYERNFQRLLVEFAK